MRVITPTAACDEIVSRRATALLLLVGHPEPAVSIVKTARRDRRLTGLMIGAPAGQPEFAEWATLLGDDGAAIPFLRYLPRAPKPIRARVEKALRGRLVEARPSSPSRATTRSPSSPKCCVPAARTGPALPDPGQALPSKALAGRSSSRGGQASAFGNGHGRRSRWWIGIRRNRSLSDPSDGDMNRAECQAGDHDRSLSGFRTAQMRVIRLLATSNASTASITSSRWRTRPG
jgi:hypothetical protein